MTRATLPLWLKFSLVTSLLVVATMGVTAWFSVRGAIASKRADCFSHFQGLGLTLAASSLASEPVDWDHVEAAIQNCFVEDVGGHDVAPIVYLVAFDREGAPRAWRVDTEALGLVDDAGRPVARPTADQVREITAGEASVRSDIDTTRIEYGESPEQKPYVVEIAYSLGPLRQETRRLILMNAAIAAALLVIGVLASVALGKWVTRPVAALTRAMSKVAEMDFTQKVEVASRDEIGILAEQFNTMAAQLEQGERARNLVSKLVSKQVAAKLLARGEEGIRGERRLCTILFADIRGFTPTAEKMLPEDLVALLNEYFTSMVDIIFKYDGILDKFIGDAIMAIWNAPIDQPDGPLRGVRAALEMQREIAMLNVRFKAQGRPPIGVGIGISTGEVVAGKMGSARKWEYTVIGDDVNLAQRIESKTAAGQVRISESTYQLLKNRVEVEALEPFLPKGKSQLVNVYRVISIPLEVPAHA